MVRCRSAGSARRWVSPARQPAKWPTRLEHRGFVTLARDRADGRQIKVSLTAAGEIYAGAVREVIEELNRDLASRVEPSDLAAADTVLRAVLADEHTQRLAEYLSMPPGPE